LCCFFVDRYCIEKHLRKYEWIYPSDSSQVLGTIKLKGKKVKVYSRLNVRKIRSKYQWFKLGYSVKSEVLENNQFVKKISKNKNKRKNQLLLNSENDNDVCEYVLLYGEWQCVKYIAPIIDYESNNGNPKIPKNERGNIEIWSKSHVPGNCVHVSNEFVLTHGLVLNELSEIELMLMKKCVGNIKNIVIVAAKNLQINFAEAMIGFDFRNRMIVPIFDGIVIVDKFESKLMKKIIVLMKLKLRKKKKKQQKECHELIIESESDDAEERESRDCRKSKLDKMEID